MEELKRSRLRYVLYIAEMGTTPLTGGRGQRHFSGPTAWPLGWDGTLNHFTRSASSFGWNPGSRSDLVGEQFVHAPDMIGESCGHSRSALAPTRLSRLIGEALAQLIVWPTQVVGAPDQIHPGVQGMQALCSMPTTPG